MTTTQTTETLPAPEIGERFTAPNGNTYVVTQLGMINLVPNPDFVFAKRVKPDGSLVSRATRVASPRPLAHPSTTV